MMQGGISSLGKIAIPAMLLLLFFGFASVAQADDVRWNGGGADNLASNPANWTGGIIPQDNDSIIFDNTSAKNCTWDESVIPSSLNLTSWYTGTVTLNSVLIVTGSVNHLRRRAHNQ